MGQKREGQEKTQWLGEGDEIVDVDAGDSLALRHVLRALILDAFHVRSQRLIEQRYRSARKQTAKSPPTRLLRHC